VTKPTKPITNLGQAMIRDQGITLGALASTCEVSRAAAQGWRNGESKPDSGNRQRIARRWPQLTEDLWDRAPSASAPAPERPPSSPVSAPAPSDGSDKDVRTRAREHLEYVTKLRQAAENGERPGDLIKLLDLERKTIMDLAKFSGELTAADESKLTETNRWKQVRAVLSETLARFPDAAREVAQKLQELNA